MVQPDRAVSNSMSAAWRVVHWAAVWELNWHVLFRSLVNPTIMWCAVAQSG